MANAVPMERTTLIRYFRQFGERASESTEMLNPLFGGRDEELAVLHNNVRVAVEVLPVNRTGSARRPGAGKMRAENSVPEPVIEQQESHVIPVSAKRCEQSATRNHYLGIFYLSFRRIEESHSM